MKWNAADYAANSAVQQTWARELITKLHLRGNEHILDVGCGDGKVSAELARAVPGGSVTGIDASAEMITFARRAFPKKLIPNLTLQIGDARRIHPVQFNSRLSAPSPHSTPGRGEGENLRMFDLVFSNAALHWVDDHQAILGGAASVLKPGGRLIVSCGGKGNAHDVFLALRPELRLKRWRDFFRGMPMPYFFYAPGDYERWLPKFGFRISGLKLAPKVVAYHGADGFAKWLGTTWLPFTQRVPEPLRADFIAAVTQRYLARHPLDAQNRVPVRMVRLEIDAVKL